MFVPCWRLIAAPEFTDCLPVLLSSDRPMSCLSLQWPSLSIFQSPDCPPVVSFSSVTVPVYPSIPCLSPVCLSHHWLFLLVLQSIVRASIDFSRITLKDNSFFVDESVKPDRPETPAEAKLIGKEFGDFLNLKVKEFWGSWKHQGKKDFGNSIPQGRGVPGFFLNVNVMVLARWDCQGLKSKSSGTFKPQGKGLTQWVWGSS